MEWECFRRDLRSAELVLDALSVRLSIGCRWKVIQSSMGRAMIAAIGHFCARLQEYISLIYARHRSVPIARQANEVSPSPWDVISDGRLSYVERYAPSIWVMSQNG
jgi:hypothetical protein